MPRGEKSTKKAKVTRTTKRATERKTAHDAKQGVKTKKQTS